MLLISQNLARYMQIPKSTVIRFNLAWVDSVESLVKSVADYDNDIFVDVPIGRTKPPNNSYTIEDLREITKIKNVKYLAISNVSSPKDIIEYQNMFTDQVVIVPKIESMDGVKNLSSIFSVLNQEKILMLDHDDLFSDLISNNIKSSEFFKYIDKVSIFCKENSIKMLKTRGVIFSDKDDYYYK